MAQEAMCKRCGFIKCECSGEQQLIKQEEEATPAPRKVNCVTIAIAGPCGAGKTSLIRQFVARAEPHPEAAAVADVPQSQEVQSNSKDERRWSQHGVQARAQLKTYRKEITVDGGDTYALQIIDVGDQPTPELALESCLRGDAAWGSTLAKRGASAVDAVVLAFALDDAKSFSRLEAFLPSSSLFHSAEWKQENDRNKLQGVTSVRKPFVILGCKSDRAWAVDIDQVYSAANWWNRSLYDYIFTENEHVLATTATAFDHESTARVFYGMVRHIRGGRDIFPPEEASTRFDRGIDQTPAQPPSPAADAPNDEEGTPWFASILPKYLVRTTAATTKDTNTYRQGPQASTRGEQPYPAGFVPAGGLLHEPTNPSPAPPS